MLADRSWIMTSAVTMATGCTVLALATIPGKIESSTSSSRAQIMTQRQVYAGLQVNGGVVSSAGLAICYTVGLVIKIRTTGAYMSLFSS